MKSINKIIILAYVLLYLVLPTFAQVSEITFSPQEKEFIPQIKWDDNKLFLTHPTGVHYQDYSCGELPEDWDEYLDPETDMCPLGDMAISLERAIAQAKEFGHSAKREIGYLTIHSMLHLLGYDHLDEGPMKKQMRAREEAIAATIEGMSRE